MEYVTMGKNQVVPLTVILEAMVAEAVAGLHVVMVIAIVVKIT
jgi:hypothetical protein